jgi:ATP-dependent protease ClpP protease subunit
VKKNWYYIQAKGTGAAEIVIYEEIGAYGISANDFHKQLKALGNVSKILMKINSLGGDPFDGLEIYHILKDHRARVDVQIINVAASSASIPVMAGTTVRMPANSFIFLHNPFVDLEGCDADTLREVINKLDKVSADMVSAYTMKTGKSEEQVKAWMKGDTWFTAEEARAAGLADEVIPAVEIAAKFDLSHFSNAPAALKRSMKPDGATIQAEIYKRWTRPNPRSGLREKIDRALNRGGLSARGRA